MQEESSPLFSGRLSLALKKSRIRAARLADESSVSKGYVSGLLSGSKPRPSFETCEKFAKVLEVSPEWLFEGDQEEALPSLSSRVQEDRVEYKVNKSSVDIRTIEVRLDRVESTLAGIMGAVERIAIALEALKDKKD